MQAEIITIGDEILIGQIVDSNSAWMAQQLNDAGIHVHRITSVADTAEAIVSGLEAAKQSAQLVLMTGGLGPTKDDITKKTLAQYFNCELVRNEAVLEDVKGHFKAFGIDMPEANIHQAMVPSTCEALRNAMGTAPGMWFDHEGVVYVSMPGVPYEMKHLMEAHVLPRAKERFETPEIVHHTILTQGIGESSLNELIEDWETELLASGLKLAFLPSAGMVRLRISGRGTNRNALEAQIDQRAQALHGIIPQYIFGKEAEQLEGLVGEQLKALNATVATAESCTGGYIAHLITSVAGSSSYYIGSVVSYANEVKTGQLGVRAADIEEHGAVSEPVVEQMATGVRSLLGTDYAIATSGIAGPDGGTDEKPVGTVWIAVAGPNGVYSKRYNFGKQRDRNIRKSALAGLNMLRKSLSNDLQA